MVSLYDWQFQVDREATKEKTDANARDHCTCGYCRNFYENVSKSCREILPFLGRFGINVEGPSELMPYEPTLLLACYRVTGKILRWGTVPLRAGRVPVSVGAGTDGSFLLWVGELRVPWTQGEPEEDVVSPANLPEFLERMEQMWQLRHDAETWIS